LAQSLITALSHRQKQACIHRDSLKVIIGERINPTGRKVMLQALQEGKLHVGPPGRTCTG
jgi:cobalamin-dependent methionine synthase I